MTNELPPDILAALGTASEETGDDPLSNMDGDDLEGIVSEMIALRETKEGLEEALKQATAAYDDVRKRRLPEKMQELGLVGPDGKGGFTHSTGAKIHLRVEVWAYVKKEYQDETYTWLKENGHGDLIKETVHPQTLRAFAKDRIQDGEPLPPGITTSMETIAVIVKPKQ